jgi:hypothetical protein
MAIQLRINETSNIVRFVYLMNSNIPLGYPGGQVGLRGTSNSDFNAASFTNNGLGGGFSWDRIISASSNTDVLTQTTGILPVSGKTFTYVPSTCPQPTVDATATAITNNSFTIGWANSISYADGYNIRWRKVDEAPTVSSWATPTAIVAGSSSYTFTGLAGSTHYVYSVEGLCSGITSSNISQVTTANTTNGRGLVKTLVNPMVYVSSTTTQPVFYTEPGRVNQEIIRLAITVDGNVSPLTVSQIDFKTTGTTLPADISNAKVYYTGTSAAFASTTAFGSPVISPNGNFSVTGSQVLSGSVANTVNYFWLAYDIPCTAINNNVVDAECTSFKIGTTQIPTITAPAGSRPIFFTIITTLQPATGVVTTGSIDNQILRINAGLTNCPIQFTQLDFTNPSTNISDIINAKVYYTTVPTFSNAVQFGNTVTSPGATFSVIGSQASAAATNNYFWLVYDIACAGTVSNIVDAGCTAVRFTNGATAASSVPSTINPTGTRAIAAPTTFSTIADGEWSSPTTWACGTVPMNSTTPVIINHNITVSDMGNIGGNVTVVTGKSLTLNIGGALTIGN